MAVGLRTVAVRVRRSQLRWREGRNLDTSLTEDSNSPDPDPAAGTLNLRRGVPYPAFGRIRMWATDGESDHVAADRIPSARDGA